MESPQPGSRGAEALKHVVPGSSIAVKYHPLFGPHDDLILLELDEKLLPDVLHERVVLRGQPDEDAVLCTQSKTYAMKFVGTSNSVLLIPPANHSEFCENPQNNDSNKEEEKVVAPVIKVVSGNIELVEAAPRLDKLKSFLLEKTYNFDEYDMENLEDNQESTIGLYSWNDLVDNIQASDEELRSGLQALSAVEINGYWRLVDGSYMDMILGMLLKNSVINDWSLNALNEDEVVSTLVSDGFPGVLARHCLRTYGTKVNEGMPGCAWKLDEKRVCIHFAREILKGGKRKLESFLDEWRQKVPDGMQPTVDLVEGEVLIERVGVETWVRAFSVASLPSTPAERFAILFRERTKWEWKDLQPYVRDLKIPGLSSEGLLLKYTRRTQPSPDAEPIFSAR
ncbi:sister chromatid cohesion protein DCC1 isoform X2 [Vigna radiata var. radiata]|uniref:Sister chromatid cohesion protein DCC1 isoform X1 n=1 Tax=Vigna radiata var. radiata TaxID=3916 RepID=A0A1S3U2L7_VIGRR|nr:sister chromatid cohesion protein DCC1 isoform X1 [Vigna radiata var. radiata]XP_022637205.1 sister chromatid cohesion protein DCC1 isoform X2 [Vigna radiata var. radiata]